MSQIDGYLDFLIPIFVLIVSLVFDSVTAIKNIHLYMRSLSGQHIATILKDFKNHPSFFNMIVFPLK